MAHTRRPVTGWLRRSPAHLLACRWRVPSGWPSTWPPWVWASSASWQAFTGDVSSGHAHWSGKAAARPHLGSGVVVGRLLMTSGCSVSHVAHSKPVMGSLPFHTAHCRGTSSRSFETNAPTFSIVKYPNAYVGLRKWFIAFYWGPTDLDSAAASSSPDGLVRLLSSIFHERR